MNEEVIIDITLNQTEARKRAAELNVTLQKQREELQKLRAEFKKNPSEELADQINDLSAEIRNNSRELDLNVKAFKANNNSINALRASVNQLTKERNDLDTSTEEGNRRFNELTTTIDNQVKKLKELESAVGDNRRNVGNYTESIKQAIDGNALFGDSLNDILGPIGSFINGFRQIITSFAAATQGINLFKAALISSGIGAILVVLGSLIAFLTQTEKGFRKLQFAINFVEGVIGTLLNDLTKLGEVIFDSAAKGIQTLIDLFSDLFATDEDDKAKNGGLGFFDRLKSGLVGFAASGPGAGSILKGLFDAIEQGTKATAGYVSKLIEGGKAVANLREQNKELEKSIRSLNIEAAKQQFIAEQNRKLRDDETKSEAERLAFNEQVLQAEEKRRDALLRSNALQRQILENEIKTRVDGAKQIAEEQDRLAQLEIERLQILEDFEGRTTEVLTESVSIRRDALLKQAESVKAAADAELLEYENKNAAILAGEQGTNEELQALLQERLKLQIAQIEADAKVKRQQAENDIRDANQLAATLRLIEAEKNAAILALNKDFSTQSTGIEQSREQTLLNIKQSSVNARLLAVKQGSDLEVELLKEQAEIERDIALLQAEQSIKDLDERLAKEAEIRAKYDAAIRQIDEKRTEADNKATESAQRTSEAYTQSVFQQIGALADQAKSLDEFVAGFKKLAFEQIRTEIRKAVTAQISKAIVSTPFPANFAIASAAGIALELAMSKLLQFAGGGVIPNGFELPKSTVKGDNTLVLAKPGEVILNKSQQALLGGAETFRKIGVPGFADGGVIPGRSVESLSLSGNVSQALTQAINNLPNPIVTVKDISSVQNKVNVIDSIASL